MEYSYDPTTESNWFYLSRHTNSGFIFPVFSALQKKPSGNYALIHENGAFTGVPIEGYNLDFSVACGQAVLAGKKKVRGGELEVFINLVLVDGLEPVVGHVPATEIKFNGGASVTVLGYMEDIDNFIDCNARTSREYYRRQGPGHYTVDR